MQTKVFIHTNDKQFLGAAVSKYTLEKHSAGRVEVDYIQLMDHPHLMGRTGQKYKRSGIEVAWDSEDLQSFTLLRFLPPQLMGYEGRALVIDPDVFACADVTELLNREMDGKAILCRWIDGKGEKPGYYASSVMLLDCAKLRHWDWDAGIDAMFAGERDYRDWVSLVDEDPATIGEIGEAWNSFDKLSPETKLLHNTSRITQPWKTGLKVDFSTIEKKAQASKPKPPARKWGVIPYPWIRAAKRAMGRQVPAPKLKDATTYQPHPDSKQERFFFTNLRDALHDGAIDHALIDEHIRMGYVREDLWQRLEAFEEPALAS